MKINISQERWAKFEQELVPLVFLSTVQIWWCINFPAVIRLGNPLNAIVGIFLCIASILLYIYIFVFADMQRSIFSSKYMDEYPHGNISRIAMALSFHLVFFLAWYNNLYRMSNLHYTFMYIYSLIGFFLIARAANRVPEITR